MSFFKRSKNAVEAKSNAAGCIDDGRRLLNVWLNVSPVRDGSAIGPKTSEIEESDAVPRIKCFFAKVLSVMKVILSYAPCVEEWCNSRSIFWIASISTSFGGGKRSIFRFVLGDNCDKRGSCMGLF